MHIVHLTASTFFGGPERQMLGLAGALPRWVRSSFVSFSEGGRSAEFLNQVREAGHGVIPLESDFPRVRATLRELCDRLRDASAQLLLSHGYKSNILGRIVARKLGIPIVGVSRGWTGESWKVSSYEWLDRIHLRFMDRVVCVSEGQAKKVRRLRVDRSRIRVIPNGARLNSFRDTDPEDRDRLRSFFPDFRDGDRIVLTAGRLSPEKGFDILIEASAKVRTEMPRTFFILFGEGSEKTKLQSLIVKYKLADCFVLGGFRGDLDRFLPWVDLVVSSSHTEGLPNVLLEAASASRPIVATRVGGTPEVVGHRVNGLLVPAGNADELARAMVTVLDDPDLARGYGVAGRVRMEQRFSFEAQARAYRELFDELLRSNDQEARVAC
jgi:glycosyltransferase involved in cell wall biosynthesis